MNRSFAVAAVLLLASHPLWAGEKQGSWDSKRYLGWEQKWGVGDSHLYYDDVNPLVRYNRVEGLLVGARVPRSYRDCQGFAPYGELAYSFGNSAWHYQAGTQVFTFQACHRDNPHLASLGAELHDLTATQDSYLVPEEANSLYAALFRRDMRDYYRRVGWSVYAVQNLAGAVQLTGRLAHDEFFNLENAVHWILLGNRLARDQFRANPAIDEGTAVRLQAEVQFDSRSNGDQRQGWLVNALAERAGDLGGEYAFRRYLIDLRRYHPIARGTQIDLRLRLGRGDGGVGRCIGDGDTCSSQGGLPRQYLFDLGGYSTLRGYPYKAFTGDRMILLNAEYWIYADHADEWRAGVLLDVGSAWFARLEDAAKIADGESLDTDFKASLGFGIGDDECQFELARPFGQRDADWHYAIRFSETF